MSDVSAVLLTMGEPTTDRAREALEAQTIPLRELITVAGVSPFHRALNQGARQVNTSFFVQVDADMILDSDAVARLRSSVTDDAGIVVGKLRDAMIGEVVGVKLFRTACFARTSFRDSISPDTDFGSEITAGGWRTVEVSDAPPCGASTLGAHARDYPLDYTFQKFSIEGSRYRYRDHPGGFRWYLSRLNPSQHPSSAVAVIAACNGVFDCTRSDLLVPVDRADLTSFTRLQEFLAGNGTAAPHQPTFVGTVREQFDRTFRLGRELWERRAASAYLDLLARIRTRPVGTTWVAQLAFCRAPFADSADCEWDRIADFVSRERRPSLRQRARRYFGWH